jgi:hypothetical protein
MKNLKASISAMLILFSTITYSQEESKKDLKTIQEVVLLEAEAKPLVANEDGSFPPADTAKPALLNSAEILKRAINFIKLETPQYKKKNAVTSGSKAECVAIFPYKLKELNPQADVEGIFSLHLSIEVKEGKYRYTISKINHISNNAAFSGGDITNEVPECGSLKLSSDLWKKIRSQGFKNANTLAGDLKSTMILSSDKNGVENEW